MKLTFKGGVHPPSTKGLTKDLPIKVLKAPEKLYVPLRQHIGAPCEPTVLVGDAVKKGQLIGKSDSFVSAPVHSPVSGKVIAIEACYHPSGVKAPAVVIENDFQDEWDPEIKPVGDYTSLSKQQIRDAVKNAGIVGMGGAAFPTHVKITPPPDKEVKYIIVNGAECEPYLTNDYRAMLEYPEEIIYGLKAVMKLFDLKEGYIGIEDNKPEGIKKIEEALGDDTSVKVCVLKAKYPQGSEKHLIKAITKKEVPSGKLPVDVGAIVINVDTAVSIANTLKTGRPVVDRVVTVTGDGVNRPCNLRVAIGTPFKDIIAEAGGLKDNVKKLISGGPMMGICQYSLDTPVIKGTSGLLALTPELINDKKELPCVRCGKCVSACPMGLMPLYISMYSKAEDFEKMKKYNIMDCIECGSCSFVCPSFKNPVEYIRMGKAKLQLQSKKEGK
ncbi:MAG: electron transport complex subunit RsxC [Ruminococcaceae bacterium]|nr:electron transport complex subunit RsxC [Oscillospiraceae bacterium]